MVVNKVGMTQKHIKIERVSYVLHTYGHMYIYIYICLRHNLHQNTIVHISIYHRNVCNSKSFNHRETTSVDNLIKKAVVETNRIRQMVFICVLRHHGI